MSLAGLDDVKQVDASSNILGVEGGKALAECLKSNTTITQVRLHLYAHANNKLRGKAARFAMPHGRKNLLS